MTNSKQSNPIILDWDADKIEKFGSEPLKFKHRAHLSPLFEDERLARLIEHAPRENYYRDGDKPALGYAVNVGYLAPDPHNKRDLGVTAAFLDAFPDL